MIRALTFKVSHTLRTLEQKCRLITTPFWFLRQFGTGSYIPNFYLPNWFDGEKLALPMGGICEKNQWIYIYLCPLSDSWPSMESGSPKARFCSYTPFIFMSPSRVAVSCSKRVLISSSRCCNFLRRWFGAKSLKSSLGSTKAIRDDCKWEKQSTR